MLLVVLTLNGGVTEGGEACLCNRQTVVHGKVLKNVTCCYISCQKSETFKKKVNTINRNYSSLLRVVHCRQAVELKFSFMSVQTHKTDLAKILIPIGKRPHLQTISIAD